MSSWRPNPPPLGKALVGTVMLTLTIGGFMLAFTNSPGVHLRALALALPVLGVMLVASFYAGVYTGRRG